MKYLFDRPFLPMLLVQVFLISLTACSTAAPVLPPAAKVEKQQIPTVHASEPSGSDTKSITPGCEAVDPNQERGACFSHAPAGGKRGGGMCQPQSIPYARCRTQSSTCRLGNTSPVQWFRCEEKRGATSPIPTAGALMAVDSNHVHNMPTGHTLYVEEVCAQTDGTYRLRVSHTNYDRRCHLEEDAWVTYDPRDRKADFASGHWAAWGKNLKVQGFILPSTMTGKAD